jgi:two-component system sensor histidine kinase MprB
VTLAMTFRRRIVLLTALAVAAAIVAASVVTYVLVRHNLRSQIDSSLNGLVPRVLVMQEAAGGSAGPARPVTGQAGQRVFHRVLSTRGDSVVLPTSKLGGPTAIVQSVAAVSGRAGPPAGAKVPITPAVRRVAAGKAAPFYRDATVDGVRLRIFTTKDAAGNAIQVARPLTEVDHTLSQLRVVLAVVALVGALVAGLLGLLVARGVLRPVARLTRATEDVSETLDLSHRIDETGGDELGRLAHSFNTMLAALDESRDAQRQLVADASHELRTPLTSIRANIELLQRAPSLDDDERRAMLRTADAQLRELTILVGDLVDLARPTGQPVEEPQRLRLDLLVEEVVERSGRHTSDVDVRVRVQPTEVVGSASRLHRAVANLLDNAIKWSPPLGVVEVVVADGEVTVRDHGPGIAAEDLPHVFDRFWRAPDSRGLPGSGLGLAIVRQVAEVHGGVAEAERADGGGTLVRLRLPVAPAAPLLAVS